MADEREPPPLEEFYSIKDEDDLFADDSETKKFEPASLILNEEKDGPASLPEDNLKTEDLFAVDAYPLESNADLLDYGEEFRKGILDLGGGTEISLEPDTEPSTTDTPTEAQPAGSALPTLNSGGTEVRLDSDEEETETPTEAQPAGVSLPSESSDVSRADEEPPRVGISQTSTTSKMSSSTMKQDKNEIEEEDPFTLEIKVCEPNRVGDGMGAYIVYKVISKTNIPAFRKTTMTVLRRFSDFLGLHEKLALKYIRDGRIVPPAPEKSVLGMTKIKMNKEESGSTEFIERRRLALQRFLSRTSAHPVLRVDPDFRDFLEKDGDLPRATSTSALSGAGVMRLFHRVGDAVEKITYKMDETDETRECFSQLYGVADARWFEEKQQQVEALDTQLQKLHRSVENLVQQRRELCLSTGQFAKSAAMLGNAEEHTALSRALSQLAETEEKVELLHKDQADQDYYVISELLKDYINLIQSVKDVFHERVKCYKNWKDAEVMLARKRENKARLEVAHKTDKLSQAQQEITEWEQKLEKGQEDFEKISEIIRKEVKFFEVCRVADFKAAVITYLEHLMETQQKLIKYWEAFLPEAKAIA
ncbi:sorting nexin-2 isoform X3 [Octopus sinensis]|uniref:Sorting nexin-2 n=1 Tax=Octopus sinensis TaxID=2607531 RepID=A0A7E6F894_9MOLL|nr:sorting nexin-2 isoform X3 [Octopus sinensis]